MNMHITQFYCFFINIMFLVEFICHQKCTSWRKLHFSACCTNDIFVDIFQNMVNIYYFGWFFVSFKSPLLFLVLLCCIARKSSAKNEFCCVSNKNYCKTRKRPRSSAISELKIEDADVKDDVKLAWHIHTWEYHAIFTSSLTSASSILSSLLPVSEHNFPTCSSLHKTH